MEIIELFLDEENEHSGIEAISVVESPAIESDFIALKNQEIKMAEVDKEKRILMGAALIPNKPIYRKNAKDDGYYVFFSKDTVKKASEMFFIRGNQSKATLEHQMSIQNLTVVESWLVDDPKKDKSVKYGLEVPEGTWMVSMKVNNDKIWNDYVKTGKVKGFSIEGFFSDQANRPKEQIEEELKSKKIEMATKQIDGRTGYDTKEEAEAVAKTMGCKGHHTHELDGQTWYMPCESHDLNEEISEELIAKIKDIICKDCDSK